MKVRICERYAIVVRVSDVEDAAPAIYETLQHVVGVLTCIEGVREVYIDDKYDDPCSIRGKTDFDYTGPVLEG